MPLSQVVLMEAYPREEQGKAMAIWGIGTMVGPIIGPTLGGWLTDELSWRWVFYINVPVGIFALLGMLASMRRGGGDARRPFDVIGFVLLALALGSFQLMLDRGQRDDWFESTEIITEAFFVAVCFCMFVAHSLTSRSLSSTSGCSATATSPSRCW